MSTGDVDGASSAQKVVQMLFVAALVAVILSTLFVSSGPLIGSDTGFEQALSIVEGQTAIPDRAYANLSVSQSLGTALRTTGDPNVTGATSGVDLGDVFDDGTWSTCTVARLNGSTSETVTLLSANGRATLQYNGSAGEWVGCYYNASDRVDYDVGVPASTPTTWTTVCLQQANSTLSIYADGATASTPLDGSHTLTVGTLEGSALNGSVDETRIYPTALTQSQRDAFAAEPTRPLGNASATARLMYDAWEPTASSVPVYVGGGTLDLEGATLASGLPGESVTEGTDYALSGKTLTTTSAKLQGAPVVFVSYEAKAGPFRPVFEAVTGIVRAALIFVVLGAFALAAGRVKDELGGGY